MAFFFVPNFCVYRQHRPASIVDGVRRLLSTAPGVYHRRASASTVDAKRQLLTQQNHPPRFTPFFQEIIPIKNYLCTGNAEICTY